MRWAVSYSKPYPALDSLLSSRRALRRTDVPRVCPGLGFARLSAGREALFVLGCRPVEIIFFFVFVKLFHARHVREQMENNERFTIGSSSVYVSTIYHWDEMRSLFLAADQ